MGHRIAPMDDEIIGIVPRQRRPRVEAGAHLQFVRGLSCVICGARPVDPAHLRTANALAGSRQVGVGEKPSDHFVTPLCRAHHYEQHSMKERFFWQSYGIDNPWMLGLALYAASIEKNAELAERIIQEHRRLVVR